MPKRSLHNPEVDDLPAYGLREDAYDDRLRSSTRLTGEERAELREHARRTEDERDEDAADDDDPYNDLDLGPQIWRRASRVTTTELCLFLGGYLLRQPVITSNINAWLSGNELKLGARQFDVPDFAERKFGFMPKAQKKDDWRGNYRMKGVRHKLVLKYDKLDPCITVRLASRQRLVIFVAGGRMHSTGHAEPGVLRDLIGRAVSWRHATPTDVLAVCVPRTEPFRRAVARWSQTEGARRLRLHFLTVERYTGAITGLEVVLAPPEGASGSTPHPRTRRG
jgi:hypothetical protein